jgi:DNA-binding PadR family transcriptional regulator
MVRSSRSNPLALAVLCCLSERPMHPYEVAQTLRSRAKHESIRLNYGSLYSVVDSLESRGLIEATETVRLGRRPERTVYAITDAGSRELVDWLSDLITTPAKEYPQFEAALSLLPALPPDDALALLESRLVALEVRRAQLAAVRQSSEAAGLPRLFNLEGEYVELLLEAELAFVRALVADLRSGHLSGLDEWRSWFLDDQPDKAPLAALPPGPPNGEEAVVSDR